MRHFRDLLRQIESNKLHQVTVAKASLVPVKKTYRAALRALKEIMAAEGRKEQLAHLPIVPARLAVLKQRFPLLAEPTPRALAPVHSGDPAEDDEDDDDDDDDDDDITAAAVLFQGEPDEVVEEKDDVDPSEDDAEDE